MERRRNNALQKLCRHYLRKLQYYADKHNLSDVLNELIERNSRKECVATEKEVMLLSRAVDDERIQRTEVPPLLSKTYRECTDNEDFDKIKKLHRVGLYSKVDTMLYAEKLKEKQKQRDNYGNKRKSTLSI